MSMQALSDQLIELRLTAFLEALREQQANPKYTELAFEDRLALLTDHECTRRRENRIQRNIQAAAFPMQAAFEDIDFSPARSLDRRSILELGQCNWITSRHNLLVLGPPGVGKHNHSNTSKSMTLDDQATVTVTDPCHPLYHHTFPLLYQTNQRELEPCCLVQIAPGVERLIPTRQTSLSTLPAAGFSCPVDLSSLHNLIKTFAHVLAQVEMESSDDSGGTTPTTSNRHASPASVGDAGSNPTTGSPASRDQPVPADPGDLGTRGQP